MSTQAENAELLALSQKSEVTFDIPGAMMTPYLLKKYMGLIFDALRPGVHCEINIEVKNGKIVRIVRAKSYIFTDNENGKGVKHGGI